MKRTQKIVIIEPSTLLVSGLKALLTADSEYEVVASFDSVQSSVGRLTQLMPDVVIINPNLLDYSKRSSIRSFIDLPDKSALIAFVSTFTDSNLLKQYDKVIDLYIDEHQLISVLHEAVKLHHDAPEQSDNYNLSEREIEILIAVAKGLTNKEIADAHNISVNTVISHRKNITRKTGIKTVAGLTVYAFLNDLIDQTDVD